MATVTDVEVANASFPTVRQDLNDILEAIATNFSADAEPTTTYANQWWYETDTDKLYIRNEANDAWIHVLTLDQTGNTVSEVQGAGGGDNIAEGNSSVEVIDTGTGYVQINVDGSEVARLDSTGLGIGTTSPARTLHLAGTNPVIRFEDTTSGNAVANIDANFDSEGSLAIDVDPGNAGASSHLQVKIDGTERMRIDSGGKLGLGTSSPSDFLINVSRGSGMGTEPTWEATSGRNIALFETDQSEGYVVIGAPANGFSQLSFADAGNKSAGGIGYSHSNNMLRLRANGVDRLRIDSSGHLLVNRTSQLADGQYSTDFAGTEQRVLSCNNTDGNTGANIMTFYSTGSQIGGITQSSGSSVAYNTSSDYRLKENVVNMTGAIDRLKQLPVHQFNFIGEDQTVDGFLAHEAQQVVPEAVTGEKDAMCTEEYEVTPAVLDEDGDVITESVMGTREVPDYQGIDQSKLVPLLTGALQEAIAKIEALETRIAALEA